MEDGASTMCSMMLIDDPKSELSCSLMPLRCFPTIPPMFHITSMLNKLPDKRLCPSRMV